MTEAIVKSRMASSTKIDPSGQIVVVLGMEMVCFALANPAFGRGSHDALVYEPFGD
jgi:hypothetical protein